MRIPDARGENEMRKMVTEIRTGSGTRTRPGGLGHDPFAIVNPISVEAATADFYEKVDADLLEAERLLAAMCAGRACRRGKGV